MKEIQSAGGPLIGLPRDHMQLWSGVFGKRFIGEGSPFRTDYEATGYPDGGCDRSRRNIAKINGLSAIGILINVPHYTAIVDIDTDSIYIIQICYSDVDWDFYLVDKSYFENAEFKSEDDIVFSCKSCAYTFFDAAYDGRDVGNDCLTFNLDAGEHVFSTAVYKPNERTELILCKITRKVDAVSSGRPI